MTVKFLKFIDAIENDNLEEFEVLFKAAYLEKSNEKGYRAIHYAAEGGHINIINKLIECNCDIEAADKNGGRAIHGAAAGGHITIINQLIEHNCEIEAADINGWRAIHYASYWGHINIINKLIECNCDIDAADKNGGRAIHGAAAGGHIIIINKLIEHKCDIEAADKKGWRAIHYAAEKGHINIINKLIECNCDINPLTKNNQSVLNIAKKYGKDECVRLLEKSLKDIQQQNEKIMKVLIKGDINAILKTLEIYSLSRIMNHIMKTSLLDELLKRNDINIIYVLKKKPVTDEEINDWKKKKDGGMNLQSYKLIQECLLYRCIEHEKGSGFDILCTPDIVNSDSLFMGPSVLEDVVEFGRIMFIKTVLSRLKEVDELWTRAINMAKKKRFDKIESVILSRKHYLDLQYKEGYSRLHIAVFDNDPEMIKYILDNKYVEEEAGNKNVGTAFSSALFMKYVGCIKVFEDRKVNVNTVDKKRQSPLQVAIDSGMEEHCEYLIKNIEDVNQRDFRGLTLLEMAVFGGCERICERLLMKGAKFDGRMEICREWRYIDPNLTMILKRPCLSKITGNETLVSLCLKTNGTIYHCLLNTLSRKGVNIKYEEGNTLLHIAARLLLSNVCSELLERGAMIDSLNDFGSTPLMGLLHKHESVDGLKNKEDDVIKTVNVLLDGKASINFKDRDGPNLLERATECRSEKLLLTLIRRGEPIECLREAQLGAWFQHYYFTMIDKSIDLIKMSLIQKWITFDVINISMTLADMSLTLKLLDRAEESVYSNVVERVLYKAAQTDDEELFKKLINTKISTGSHLKEGDPLLHRLIVDRNIKYCKIVFKSENLNILVDEKNVYDKLPLHVCIESDVSEVMDTLIMETKGVNLEDSGGDTPLSLLLTKISELSTEEDVERIMVYIKTIINKMGDIYAVNKFNQMVISFCKNKNLRAQIETFYNRHQLPNQATNVPENMICRVCRDKIVDCVFDCGHVFCMDCGQKVYPCPMCRAAPTNPKKMLL